ncbi:MAG: flagellar hook-length control protein FliK [Nitrospiria bacterium]
MAALAPTTDNVDHKHKEVLYEESGSTGQFNQVLMKTSEERARLGTRELLLLEGEMENPEISEAPHTLDALIQTSFSGEDLPLLKDGEEEKKLEESGVIVTPAATVIREEVKHTSIGEGDLSMTALSEIEGESSQKEIALIPHTDSEDKGKGVGVRATLNPPEGEDVIRSSKALNAEPFADLDSERASLPGIPKVLADLEGEGSMPVRGLEAVSSPDQMDLERASLRPLISGASPSREAKPERSGQAEPDHSILFGLDGKDDEENRSLPRIESSGTEFEEENNHKFHGEEGAEVSPLLVDNKISEEFSSGPLAETEPEFNINNKSEAHAVESRFSDALPSGKVLLRQVLEKIQLWRSNENNAIRFQLEPETLGMLKIDISKGDNGIIAEIITEHHFVKTILEKNQSLLHEALSDKGLRIEHFTVDVGAQGHQPADTQKKDPMWEAPRIFSEQEEVNSLSGLSQIRPSGDGGINIYI